MVAIRINGEERDVPAGTVDGLVRLLEREPRAVAVEYNGEILPRDRYEETTLADGDRLEIVHFVQGG